MIEDKTDTERLNQAMTQEQLKKYQIENQKKKGTKMQTAYKVVSAVGRKMQQL